MENEQLRQLLDMKSKLQATKTLAADVIMRSPVSWKQELTLDAGKSKGASENMLAIANGGFGWECLKSRGEILLWSTF